MLKTNKNINRFIDQVVAIHDLSAEAAREIAYLPRQFVIAPLPYSKPSSYFYKRRNGSYTLTMMADPKYGLPYGALARLLLARITTEAVKKESRLIHTGKLFKNFLQELNLTSSGGKKGDATRLKDQLLRIMTTHISGIDEQKSFHREAIIGDQLQLVRSFKLAWMPAITKSKDDIPEGCIKLSHDFFEELTENCVPIDRRALQALRRSPLQMDIYVWLTHRFYYLKKPQMISWATLKIQFGSDYANNLQGLRDFKRKFSQSLLPVILIYKKAKVETLKNGIRLLPSPPHVEKRVSKKRKKDTKKDVDNPVN